MSAEQDTAMYDQPDDDKLNADAERVAREAAWQLRRSHASTPVTLWVPVVLAGCSVALQLVALVAILLQTF